MNGPDSLSTDLQGRLAELCRAHGLDERVREGLARILNELAADDHAPTTVRVPEEALERHLADSLVGLEIPQLATARTVADIGSGAGFPGLPLALALPSTRMFLVESIARKCTFLRRMKVALAADNVEVVCRRVEEWRDGTGACEAVVARALAYPPVVLEYAAPLLAPEGILVDWRGRVAEAEAAAALTAAEQLGLAQIDRRDVEPYSGASGLTLYVYQKVRTTPELFPRRPGTARRRPLGGEPTR